MAVVMWKLADGSEGEHALVGDGTWTFGRGAEASARFEHPALSRTAISINADGPAPALRVDQRPNGARVALVSLLGSVRWLESGSVTALTDVENRVELHLGDQHVLTADVQFGGAVTVGSSPRV